QPAGEPDRVDDGGRAPPPGQALDGPVEEADVEARVVRGERRVTREREEAAYGELRKRCGSQFRVVQAGQAGDRGWKRHPRADEGLEGVPHLERLDADGADLADAVP